MLELKGLEQLRREDIRFALEFNAVVHAISCQGLHLNIHDPNMSDIFFSRLKDLSLHRNLK